ncbi:hypothetical protein P1X14_12610 [Sphingomonas sp. AOB5]|uniref:hypothetical protein n=1 Tax=Sphingomonas sp. AOB5 TaxID=3034017 RepID=UPI0023FA1501|nr:hypothetical protein [Sphingomonas sp. AOB5]MDF7776093.1 hypothetical protein [Sphingomonas sp. AOB5]
MKSIIAFAAMLLCGSALPAQDIPIPGGKARTPPVKPATPRTGGPGADQGITGPLHAANVGKLVFTRTDLELRAINAGSFASGFGLGDPIYFRAYMAKSSVNAVAPMMGGQGNYAHRIRYRMIFRVDGGAPVETSIRAWGTAKEHAEWTTWRGQFLDRTGSKVPGNDAFRELLSKAMARGQLGPGSHQIEVELIPTVANGDNPPIVGPVVARGSFTLSVSAGAVRPDDPQICLPPAAMRNAGIENAILNRARQTWKDSATRPERVLITHTGWTFYRHPVSGIVTRRAIDARILARGSTYCTVQGYAYSQAAVGSGFESQGDFSGAEEYTSYLPCACLK